MPGKNLIITVGLALLISGCDSALATNSRDPNLSKSPPPVAAFDYACDTGAVLHIEWWAKKVMVSFKGHDRVKTWILPSARSGSGARFSDGKREVWEHQGAVRVSGPDVGRLLCHKMDVNGA